MLLRKIDVEPLVCVRATVGQTAAPPRSVMKARRPII